MFAQVDWVQLLQTFGLAVVILFFVGLAVWKAGGWFGREIVIPFRDTGLKRFLEFLGMIEATVRKVDANVDEVTGNLSEQTEALKGIQAVNTQVKDSTERVADALEEEHASLKTMIATAVSEGKARQELVLAEIAKVQADVKLILNKMENRERG